MRRWNDHSTKAICARTRIVVSCRSLRFFHHLRKVGLRLRVRRDSMDSRESVYCCRHETLFRDRSGSHARAHRCLIVHAAPQSACGARRRPADDRTTDRHPPSVEPGVVAGWHATWRFCRNAPASRNIFVADVTASSSAVGRARADALRRRPGRRLFLERRQHAHLFSARRRSLAGRAQRRRPVGGLVDAAVGVGHRAVARRQRASRSCVRRSRRRAASPMPGHGRCRAGRPRPRRRRRAE